MNDLRVPTRTPHTHPTTESGQSTSHQPRASRRRFSLVPLTAAIVALVVLGGILFYVFMPKGQAINTTGYQVVYLASGQAYFGKLKNTTGEYLVIDSPYTAQDVKASDDKSANPQTTLIKVSNQLYGPTDSIAIRASEVSFWQNLRDDSKVVQAIKAKQ